MVTNWRNTVVRCKFLVASLYNVNEASHSMTRSIRFHCLKISRTEVGINWELNWLCFNMQFGTFFVTKAKQNKMKCSF